MVRLLFNSRIHRVIEAAKRLNDVWFTIKTGGSVKSAQIVKGGKRVIIGSSGVTSHSNCNEH